VRAEIRKAAVARRTTVDVGRVAQLAQPLRASERELLWSLVHEPERVLPALNDAQDIDLEGLRSYELLRTARDLARQEPGAAPATLFGRLHEDDAQLLSAIAAHPAPPSRGAEQCLRDLRLHRLKRELSEIQAAIQRLQAAADTNDELMALLTRKLGLSREIAIVEASLIGLK
jgi:hypothetical protein